MSQQLEGFQFLEANQIENKECDMKKPFAFISYAHYPDDSHIVRNVFYSLYEKGYNLWIDTANIPKDENSWEDAAQDALIEDNCKLALFFRSEESLIREPIRDELQFIKARDNISRIVTIDIWHDENNTAEKFRKNLIKEVTKENKYKLNILKEIYSYVNFNNSAFRMCDGNANLSNLVENLAKELEKEGIYPQINTDSTSTDSTATDSTGTDSTDTDSTDTDSTGTDSTDTDSTDDTDFTDIDPNSYVYKIFGKKYKAETQSTIVYNVFKVISDKYPAKINSIVKTCNAVEYAKNVKNQNTKSSSPIQFKSSKDFKVNGKNVLVSSSYSFEDKLTQISKML